MTAFTNTTALASTFPVSYEMLLALHDAACKRTDDINSIQLCDRAGRPTEVLSLDIIAAKPSYYDFSDVPHDLEQNGTVPSTLMWRPVDADKDSDAASEQYAPIMIRQPWGIVFIEDHSANIGDEEGELLTIAAVPNHWVAHVNDLSYAITHKPDITFDISQHSVDDSVMGVVILDSEPFAYVTYSDAGLGMSYVNDPMFSNDIDFIGKASEVGHADIIEAAYAHWMACNAAGIEQ